MLRPKSGGREVALPVLAATLTTAIVFFPVIFLYGVSRFLFTALALAVVLALFASVLRRDDGGAVVLREIDQSTSHATTSGACTPRARQPERFNGWFNAKFQAMLVEYDWAIAQR